MCLTTASNSDCYITHIAAQDLGSLVLQQLKVLQVLQGATAADETAEFISEVLTAAAAALLLPQETLVSSLEALANERGRWVEDPPLQQDWVFGVPFVETLGAPNIQIFSNSQMFSHSEDIRMCQITYPTF